MNLTQTLRRIRQQSNGGWNKSFDSQSAQMPLIKRLYKNNGLRIKMTCGACPEQYDVFKDGKQVAYYRLRHGEFRVDVPDVMGETVYYEQPAGDGIFNPDERLVQLTKAMHAVLNSLTPSTNQK